MSPLRAALPIAFVCFLLFSTAQAQFFLGTANSVLIIRNGGVGFFVGVQGGSYDLGSNLGVRGSLELFPAVADGTTLLQAEATGLYVVGEGIKFYLGPSLGLASLGGAVNPFGGLAVGVDFDSESVISYFIEAQPRYYFGGAPALGVRSGLNFHIGL